MNKHTICDILRSNTIIDKIPHTITELNEYIKEVMKLDKRILNFEDHNFSNKNLKNLVLEKSVNRKIILFAGDGFDHESGNTDIQFFYDNYKKENKQVIYVCKPSFWINRYNNHISAGDALFDNIYYLRKNPDIKVLLCFMDITNTDQCEKFTKLFKNKINEIDSDEPYLIQYLDPLYCCKLLTKNGKCININHMWIRLFENFKLFNITKNNQHKKISIYKIDKYGYIFNNRSRFIQSYSAKFNSDFMWYDISNDIDINDNDVYTKKSIESIMSNKSINSNTKIIMVYWGSNIIMFHPFIIL